LRKYLFPGIIHPMASQENIRNFCIIAHIDHGKTTLTDCLLRLTRTVADFEFEERMMDSNPIEKERGITIKLAPVRMEYTLLPQNAQQAAEHSNLQHSTVGQKYVLNLIDTPGHVDFGYEVSRSLAACEGALLVVDATQGVQAQTLSTYEKAKDLGLVIIPVINKIDLPSADVERTTLELMEMFNVDEHDILKVSAKSALNIEELLRAIIERIPAPIGIVDAPARGLLITSLFDQHKGAIALVRIVDGALRKGDKLEFVRAGISMMPLEIGIYNPIMQKRDDLITGEVGYIATGLKDVRSLKVGDTVTKASDAANVTPLAGYKEPQPMVFLELYPIDASEFSELQDAMSKLVLRDAALQYVGTHSEALGSGLRVGFLGILHAEIVLERLSREFNLELIATSPSVPYQVQMRTGEEIEIHSPAQLPDPSQILNIKEPVAEINLFTPERFSGTVLQMVRERRGHLLESRVVGERIRLDCEVPLSELITDFHDKLKSVTSGYASFEYAVKGFMDVDAVKVDVLLNQEVVEALSFMCVRENAESEGRKIVTKLKEILPRQMFEVPVQAAIGGKVVARETIKAFRKDVTQHLYGGDVTRRKKLLSKQAKGKKKMKQMGRVEVDQDTFLKLLRRD
jgi:GTP-binding protein LepA